MQIGPLVSVCTLAVLTSLATIQPAYAQRDSGSSGIRTGGGSGTCENRLINRAYLCNFASSFDTQFQDIFVFSDDIGLGYGTADFELIVASLFPQIFSCSCTASRNGQAGLKQSPTGWHCVNQLPGSTLNISFAGNTDRTGEQLPEVQATQEFGDSFIGTCQETDPVPTSTSPSFKTNPYIE